MAPGYGGTHRATIPREVELLTSGSSSGRILGGGRYGDCTFECTLAEACMTAASTIWMSGGWIASGPPATGTCHTIET